ncbi:phytanoyl-CoA dioxygenase family protein [Candidatus Pelagibacter sp.]|nr:phytanoyl-CoA dioxygenase family protein [Candidatus Pelagibacter sp.]|tara:strand:+ start:706 stop:1554 length:849 start_codon:yes stop_codon:yes gene_type:complete
MNKKILLGTIKKFKILSFFFIKRIITLFKKYKSENLTVNKIVDSLEEKSFYYYPNFYSSHEIRLIKDELEEVERHCKEDNKYIKRDLTIDKQRYFVKNYKTKEIQKFVQNSLILDVSKHFHRVVSPVEKTTYEIKKPGNNPEKPNLRDVKDDTVFFHFDRPYKVLKTMLLLEDVENKDGPFQIVSGSHKLSYKSPIRKILKYISKIFFYNHHYLLAHKDEKNFINKDDIIHCVGKKGDLYLVNTEAWHCGRPLEKNGYRKVIWNYIYSDCFKNWVKQLSFKN